MSVKIVTDSTADIPQELVDELGIKVVPLYLLFGEETFRDDIDITKDEFYERLPKDPIHPTTTQPTPSDFVKVYKELEDDADAIISIHISDKLSGTLNSAIQGAKEIKKCPTTIIDSKSVAMALGLLVIKAAEMAKEGKPAEKIAAAVKSAVDNIHILVLFDTLHYLAKGGRIGKAQALVGNILNVKPILTMDDGAFIPLTKVRNRKKGIDRIINYLTEGSDIEDIAVIHSTTPEEGKILAEKVSAVLPNQKIRTARLGAVLGVHGGPGVLAIAFIGKRKAAAS